MQVQGDQLINDTRNDRVMVRGSAVIHYMGYVVEADEIIFNRQPLGLIAQGNARLRDPNGQMTYADRFELNDDVRDAFGQYLRSSSQ